MTVSGYLGLRIKTAKHKPLSPMFRPNHFAGESKRILALSRRVDFEPLTTDSKEACVAVRSRPKGAPPMLSYLKMIFPINGGPNGQHNCIGF